MHRMFCSNQIHFTLGITRSDPRIAGSSSRRTNHCGEYMGRCGKGDGKKLEIIYKFLMTTRIECSSARPYLSTLIFVGQ
jgi:hypothetical protein